jgi:type I restriction enzyme S subunit
MNNYQITHDNSVSISIKKAKELSSYTLLENDVLIARRGEMGRTAYVTAKEKGWICGTGSMIIRFPQKYLGQLFTLLLSSEQVKKYLNDNCNGTTMSNLNEKIVKSLPFPQISETEQEILLSIIESRLSVCDKLESLIEETLTKADALRQSILKKAFAGQLVPQDPTDEPAEKLLERIRAERQVSSAKPKSARRKKNG